MNRYYSKMINDLITDIWMNEIEKPLDENCNYKDYQEGRKFLIAIYKRLDEEIIIKK